MSRETEFLDRWRVESPAYSAWGKFVAIELSRVIAGFVSPVGLEVFLKLPVVPRLKTADSLVQKAFHRNKSYENPYDDIEDKVGLRIVVLLSEDIMKVDTAINSFGGWLVEKARDYVKEQQARPYEFEYQSVHYVLRSRLPFNFDGVDIPADLPCELQVRTLLQHAYSELTHDTIYKPSVQSTPSLKRAAAKSMALIEATSDYFSAVSKEIGRNVANSRDISRILEGKYSEWIAQDFAMGPLNSSLVDHYGNLPLSVLSAELDEWWQKKSFLRDSILSRREGQILYRVPAILLVYFCVTKARSVAKINSPLSDAELAPIYSDLGFALDSA